MSAAPHTETPDELDDSGPSSSDALLREVAHAPHLALPADDELRSGSRLGRFRILERLGRGGMGIVYAARDEKLSRVVAIKLLHAHATLDPNRRRRLTREAQAASAVSHPGIATVFDVGEIDGQLFVAMERVSGRTLRARISEGPLELDEVVRIGTAIADALGAAHRAGIVHRDLKPDNVMIDAGGGIKILDFGLAKPLESSELEELGSSMEQMTQEGRILGTPSYMSPEQATGEPVDVRSDVFSLGVVLYEMIAGTRPFGGGTRMQTLVAVTRDRHEPVSRRRAGVPKGLSRIVERCLEKDPAARPASGAAVAAELERAFEGPALTPRRMAIAAGIAAAAAAALWAVLPGRAPSAVQPPSAPEVASAATHEPSPPATVATPEPTSESSPSAPTAPRQSARAAAPRSSAQARAAAASAAPPAVSASARAPRDPLGVQK